MRRLIIAFALAALVLPILLALRCPLPEPVDRDKIELPGLSDRVRVSTDALGVPHVSATTFEDAARVQGYLHARDRFFQMDISRRNAYGRRAELTGTFGDLIADAESRLWGFAAAAERELALLGEEELRLLQAYADGVNAYLAAHPLPGQHAALEVSTVPPWTVLDMLAMGKANQISFSGLLYEPSYEEDLRSYQAALGEDEGRALFFEDVVRVDPIFAAATVPDAGGELPFVEGASASGSSSAGAARQSAGASAGPCDILSWRDRERGWGSSAWGVAASHTAEGVPLIAYDPHLPATSPADTYEIHLVAEQDPRYGRVNLSGMSFPGSPGVAFGQSEHVAWGVTTDFSDHGDFFWDTLLRGDPRCSAPLCIESAGELHPVEERSEAYRMNSVGNGVQDDSIDATFFVASLAPQAVNVLSVPFRSFGPVIAVTDRGVVDDPGGLPAQTTVLTVQSTTLHGGQGVRCQLGYLVARSVDEFDAALDLCPPGHYVFADRAGRLAYRMAGEIPLRADLEAGVLHGDLPIFYRDGSGPANWIPDPARSQGQQIPFAVIPRGEMPRVMDPPAGFVVSANNDPLSEGFDNDLLNQHRRSNPEAIYYVGPAYVSRLRAGGITRMIRELLDSGQAISMDDLKRMQADTRLLDAELLVPFLLDAHVNAAAPGAPAELAAFRDDPELAEAIARLEAWDFSTPTGVPDGYDASDVDGQRAATVDPEEAANSVAATLYSVWRAKLLKSTMLSALSGLGVNDNYSLMTLSGLHHLLAGKPFTGVGASGVDFFADPLGLTAPERRDHALLRSLRNTLDALASGTYAAAFGNSSVQDDYRWGKLHRLVLSNPSGETIPPAGGFEDLVPGSLRGMARDGGLETPNRGAGGAYADGVNAFTMECASSVACDYIADARFVMAPGHPEARPDGVLGYASLKGGASEDPLSPFYASQLAKWLTVDYHRMPMNARDVRVAAERVELFTPGVP